MGEDDGDAVRRSVVDVGGWQVDWLVWEPTVIQICGAEQPLIRRDTEGVNAYRKRLCEGAGVVRGNRAPQIFCGSRTSTHNSKSIYVQRMK